MKKISIVTVVRNNKAGFETTAQSIISQTADTKDWEWIVIDGASTDGTIDSIKAYSQHIAHWISEPDKGIYNAMNKSLQFCNGVYLLFMNSGDTLAENLTIDNILSISHLFQKGGQYSYLIGGTNLTINNRFVNYEKAPKYIPGKDLFKHSICHQSTLIKRSNLVNNNGYDESYKLLADAKYFFEELIIRNEPFLSLDFAVANYDVTGLSTTQTALNYQERERFLHELLPSKIYEDYHRMAYGKTTLEKLLIKMGENSISYKFLSMIAIMLYSPKAITNRIKMRLKNIRK